MHLLIVNHHYYRDEPQSRSIFPSTQQSLDASIDELNFHGWKFIDENILCESINNNLFPIGKYVFFTFDDGLKEQMSAYHHLLSKGIQALFFPSTMTIGSTSLLDVHQLHYLRHKISDEDIISSLPSIHKHLINILQQDLCNGQYRYDCPSSAKLKYYINFCIGAAKRKHLLNSLYEIFNLDQEYIAKNLYMDVDDLQRLSQTSSIGSHSHSHRPLAILDTDELREELTLSKHIIEDITGRCIRGVSYPYGGPSAVSSEVYSCSSLSGYTYGLTMSRGINIFPDPSLELRLTRIDINDLRDFVDLF